MSDYSPQDSPPDSPSIPRRNHNRNHDPNLDLPLSWDSLERVEVLTQALAHLIDRMDVSGASAGGLIDIEMPASPDRLRALHQDTSPRTVRSQNPGPVGREERALRERKPPMTLTSALKPTTYKEEDDDDDDEKGGKPRSLGYIRAQRAALEFLNIDAADRLTVGHARAITENINDNKYPSAQDALQLCYYMRSQGFDTYAKVDMKKATIKLFIANPVTEDRSKDKLYWKQNIKTNRINDINVRNARSSRRYAISGSDVTHMPLTSLFTGLETAGQAQVQTHQQTEENDSDDDGDGGDDDEGAAHSERARLMDELMTAQGELDALLTSGTPDEVRLTELLERVPILQAQVDSAGS